MVYQLTFLEGYLPRLAPLEFPLEFEPDAVAFEKEENAVIDLPYPHRFEPLLRSLAITCPEFNVTNIDLITGSNSLRKLILFASEQARVDFRIDLEILGRTLMMSRWDSKPSDLLQKSVFWGYGFGFENACVHHNEDSRGNASYHRIVHYSLADIKCLVQYEADAYSCSCHPESKNSLMPYQENEPTIPRSEHGTDQSKEELHILRRGSLLPSSCLIEIKTRRKKKENIDDILVQLWLAQIQRIYLGRHSKGRFRREDAMERDMSEEISEWEENNYITLQRLVGIINKIRNVVESTNKRTMNRKFALVYKHDKLPGQITIYSRDDERDMVPQDLAQKIWFSTNGLDTNANVDPSVSEGPDK